VNFSKSSTSREGGIDLDRRRNKIVHQATEVSVMRYKDACAIGLWLTFAASTFPANAQCAVDTKLSGVYEGNDGGTYWVRTIGTKVFWLGMGPGAKPSFTNVFRGESKNGTVTGDWADVAGADRGSGVLIVGGSTDSFTKRGGSGSPFGASVWKNKRQSGGGCADTAGSPAN
jgi:hypothetical protein